MLSLLKKCVMFVLEPPWEKEGPETFTLAVPEAHSTFKRGDVGWAKRPPAVVECPTCSSSFTHEFANDFIDCPTCGFESPPDEFGKVDVLMFACPHCQRQLDYGVRHPEMMDFPEWASCTDCQYHWEYQHDYDD